MNTEARSSYALLNCLSSWALVSSIATGLPWGQYLSPRRPGPPGAPLILICAGRVNLPGIKVLPAAKRLGRATWRGLGQVTLF